MVRPIQIPRVLKFLVFPGPVVAHLQGQLHVPLQCFVAGRGEQSIRPIALIQHQPLENGIRVQHHVAVLHADFPEAKIGVHLIADFSIHHGFDGQIVQIGMAGPPDMNSLQALVMVQIQFGLDVPIRCDFNFLPGHSLSPEGDGQAHRAILGQLVQFNFRLDRPRFNVPGKPEIHGIIFPNPFQPHALPDAGNRSVPAGKGLGPVGLLAPGLIKVQPILTAHGQAAGFLSLRQVRNIEGKGRIAPFMTTQILAVQPHIRLVIHRAEMQQAAEGAQLFRKDEIPFVPYRVAMLLAVDAAELALVGEGNLDLQGIIPARVPFFFLPRVFPVKSKAPGAVQGHPIFPLPVGPGMLGPKNGGHDALLPSAADSAMESSRIIIA